MKQNKNQPKPLSNFDILDLAEKMKIPHFKGVFMRDNLLKQNKKNQKPKTKECWILNQASEQTDGSHWCCLVKVYNKSYYFDSFGKLPPPLEIIDYLDNDTQLYYNAKKYQRFDSNICGHLCLKFLYSFWQHYGKVKKKKV